MSVEETECGVGEWGSTSAAFPVERTRLKKVNGRDSASGDVDMNDTNVSAPLLILVMLCTTSYRVDDQVLREWRISLL